MFIFENAEFNLDIACSILLDSGFRVEAVLFEFDFPIISGLNDTSISSYVPKLMSGSGRLLFYCFSYLIYNL